MVSWTWSVLIGTTIQCCYENGSFGRKQHEGSFRCDWLSWTTSFKRNCCLVTKSNTNTMLAQTVPRWTWPWCSNRTPMDTQLTMSSSPFSFNLQKLHKFFFLNFFKKFFLMVCLDWLGLAGWLVKFQKREIEWSRLNGRLDHAVGMWDVVGSDIHLIWACKERKSFSELWPLRHLTNLPVSVCDFVGR